MSIANSPATYSGKFQVGVWAAVVILALGLSEFLLHFVPLYNYEWMSAVLLVGGSVVFFAGLCGTYCGLSLIFTDRGFADCAGFHLCGSPLPRIFRMGHQFTMTAWSNNCVQATPDCACCEFVHQEPGAPERN